MNELGAWRVFVSVSERASFTVGAAAENVPQSVASRRIAALESRLGGRLLDRSSRQATLTSLGRAVLPSAKRLVRLAESIERDAARALTAPYRLLLPSVCEVPDLARLAAQGRAAGLPLDIEQADPLEREERVRSREASAAIVAVAPAEARWTVPLGLAGRDDAGGGEVLLDSLRLSRREPPSARRRVWVQPEDDVPAVRDRLARARDAAGLAPAQVASATLTTAVAEVLGSRDLLLCSPRQAVSFGLHWRPIGDLLVRRSYGIVAATGDDAVRVAEAVGDGIARCLGAESTGADS
jgi:DNA-binding transcriptional LysR family regulator